MRVMVARDRGREGVVAPSGCMTMHTMAGQVQTNEPI